MDNGCDTTTCCCLTGQITLSQTTNNQMRISGSITGQCTGFSSPITLTTSIPTTYQTTFSWSGETIRLQIESG